MSTRTALSGRCSGYSYLSAASYPRVNLGCSSGQADSEAVLWSVCKTRDGVASRYDPGPKITLLRDKGSQHRLGSELDSRAGAENPTKLVFGPYSDVRFGGLHQHGRLEAVPGKRFHCL